MKFSFTGELGLNKLESKLPWYSTGKTKKGADYKRLNLAVIKAKNNRAMTELFGQVSEALKLKDTDGNDIEIKWADRFDEDIVDKVSNFNKHVAIYHDENGNEVRKTFVAEYDFINYIIENIDMFKGKVRITGDVKKSIYNGNIKNVFNIKNIYSVDDEVANKLQISVRYIWNKDSIDLADWAENKQINFSGYTREYISKNDLGADKGAYKYIEQTLVFDCSKVDFDDPKHVKLVEFKLSNLGIDYNNNQPKIKIKNDYVSMDLVVNYVEGAEEVEFDESQLTATQKEAIELGLNTIDDFKPRNSIFGEKKKIYKIVNFNLVGDYSEGYVKIDETQAEFEEEIFTPVANVASLEDELKDATPAADDKAVEEELEDLFG